MKFSIHIILFVLHLLVCNSELHAQAFGVTEIRLGGPVNNILIQPGTPTAPRTFTFPDAAGTFLVNDGSGVSSAWLLGGNDLSGPANNLIGSTTAHNVIVVAGGALAANHRLTLLSGSNAVQTGNGTEIRLTEPTGGGGTEYTAFVAQAQSGNITYTLPATNGTTGQVLSVAASPAPTAAAATLEWVTPSAGGNGAVRSFKTTANVGSNDDVNFTNVAQLQASVAANTTYAFEYTILTSNTGGGAGANGDMDVRFEFPSGEMELVITRFFNNGAEAVTTNHGSAFIRSVATSPVLIDNVDTDANQRYFTFKGSLVVGGTGGNLTLNIRRGTGDMTARVLQFSTLLIQN